MICAAPEIVKSFAWDFFVFFFYAQVMGLNGFLLATAITVAIVCNIAVDPYIGALSDRLTGARFGKRHTLMFAGILPYMIGITGLFAAPHGMSQMQIFAWLLGFGLITRVGISFWTVPAYALGGELTDGEGERRLIATLRNMGNQLVILTVPFIALEYIFAPSAQFPRGQLNPVPYPGFGLFVAVLGGVLMLIGGLGTLRTAMTLEQSGSPSARQPSRKFLELWRDFWRAARITPNIGRLMMVAFLVLFVNSVINSLSLHLATYFWQLGHHWTPRLQIGATLGSILAMFLAPAFTRWLGSRRAMMTGLACFFLAQVVAIALPLFGLAPPPSTEAIGAFVVMARFAGGLAYGLYVVPFNVVTYDIGDEHQANTGHPSQGIVGSVMFMGLQLGSAVSNLLSGSFLGLIKFPVGIPLDKMPQDKVQALVMFILFLIVTAGGAMAWFVGTFRTRSTQ